LLVEQVWASEMRYATTPTMDLGRLGLTPLNL
jgi:hypothetical protein